MGRVAAVLFSAALLGRPCAAADDSDVSVGGVQKVIQMLTSITEKAKTEKADEEVDFAKFETWCGQQQVSLKEDVARNTEDITVLTASVGKLESESKVLGEEIAKLNTDLTKLKADEKAQKEQRKKDHEEFLAQEKDLTESVDAIERAIRFLEKKAQDVPGSRALLLQLTSSESRLPLKAKNIVSAFVDMLGGSEDEDEDPDFAAYTAPVANAYESQSGGIIEMLKKLHGDFRGQLSTLQKQELNSKHASDLIVQDLVGSISNAEKQVAEKSSAKLGKEEKAALDKKQLTATVSVKKENEKTLKDITTECREKKMSFQEKQNLRAEELEALAKAMEIVSSPDVLGGAQKHLALAQGQGTVLAQIRGRRAASASESVHHRIREFLSSESRRLHSKQLAFLAERIAADPFAKVKDMLMNMINKLHEEGLADAKKEGFCNAELGKSQLTRTRLQESIDSITAAIDSGKSTILTLSDKITALSKEISDLQTAVGEATELRAEEKKKNAETIKDAEVGQAAVERAMKVLKDFYSKALTATALVQTQAPGYGLKSTIKMGSPEWQALANPRFNPDTLDTGHQQGMQTFGAVYKGAQDEINNGVLALMEVIVSDFANLKVDTKASEAAAQKAFDEFVSESKKNIAVKGKTIEMSSSDKASAEVKVQEDTKTLKRTEDELLAAERYHEELVPQCVDTGPTHEEKVAARAEELKSLKEAMDFLGQ